MFSDWVMFVIDGETSLPSVRTKSCTFKLSFTPPFLFFFVKKTTLLEELFVFKAGVDQSEAWFLAEIDF